MGFLAGPRMYLFFCFLLAPISDPRTPRTERDTACWRISTSRSTYTWASSGDMVCTYAALVFERSTYLGHLVLDRNGSLFTTSAECLAPWHADDLFRMFPVIRKRSTRFFRLSVGRDVTRSGVYRTLLRANRHPSEIRLCFGAFACQSVPASMGMVSHLL